MTTQHPVGKICQCHTHARFLASIRIEAFGTALNDVSFIKIPKTDRKEDFIVEHLLFKV